MPKSKMQVHPVAELIRMMNDIELERLVSDIREHGLFDPIVTHGGVLLDGRNRLKACEMAGVEPRFQEYQGEEKDIEFYIVSKNNRRNLTKKEQTEYMRALRQHGMTLQAIADATGVSVKTAHRATEDLCHLTKVEGADGKSYPTHYAARLEKAEVTPEEKAEDAVPPEADQMPEYKPLTRKEQRELDALPPCVGRLLAGRAISVLEQIAGNDRERKEAFQLVKWWIEKHED